MVPRRSTNRKGTQPETLIVKSIMEYLRWTGHIVVRVYGGGHVKNGKFFPQPYLERGTADLLVCIKGTGRFLALEVKTEKGKPSEFQTGWLQRVRDAGGLAEVVRSIEDVERIIRGI